jgi:hypothetical protein
VTFAGSNLARHVGEVTSRTRHRRLYARKDSPFSWPLPALSVGPAPQTASSAVCLTPSRTGAHYPGRECPLLAQRGAYFLIVFGFGPVTWVRPARV